MQTMEDSIGGNEVAWAHLGLLVGMTCTETHCTSVVQHVLLKPVASLRLLLVARQKSVC